MEAFSLLELKLMGFLRSFEYPATFILRGAAILGTMVVPQTWQKVIQANTQRIDAQLEDLKHCR